jgi:hypothetical protein
VKLNTWDTALTAEQMTNSERAIQGLGINGKRLALDIDDAKAKVNLAEQKHKDAVKYQRFREDQLNSAMARKFEMCTPPEFES